MHPFPAMQVCGRIPENSFLQGTSDSYRMLIVGLQELDLPTGKGNLLLYTKPFAEARCCRSGGDDVGILDAFGGLCFRVVGQTCCDSGEGPQRSECIAIMISYKARKHDCHIKGLGGIL